MDFHAVSTGTRDRLRAAGLDPDAVVATVEAAVDEDLMGGVDVTSVATVPADHRSTGTFGSRADGVVAGLGRRGRRRRGGVRRRGIGVRVPRRGR